MKYIVLGVQEVDYISNKTGKQVQGINLHCKYETKNVDGEAVEKIYISSAVETPIISVGDNLNIYYNRYGGVDKVEFAD